MGESINVIRIEVIKQDRPDFGLNRTLLQIDFEYSESKTKGRIFIDSQEFFKLISNPQ